ncbi:MAG: FkbM family methyltransferase [Holophagales bacterium]|jgi:FkbM family methyltransferase|nr:FkbM family methyltransferase [Holophagales bacterium]
MTPDNINSVAVVIPIYLPVIYGVELFSLRYSLSKLSPNRDIYFVCPESLGTEFYSNQAPNAKFVTFDDNYFQSIRDYNRLLLSSFFYEKFDAYEFILICQTDAIVLRDELDYWCEQKYDYIGAPWPSMISNTGEIVRINDKYKVGNGGLSLRRINKCIELLNEFPEPVPDFLSYNKMSNEDKFFAVHGYLSNNFSMPSELVASKFSLEIKPDYFYKLNSHHIPMGGHAWYKHNPVFWQGILQQDHELVTEIYSEIKKFMVEPPKDFNSELSGMIAKAENKARLPEIMINAVRTTLNGRPFALYGRWSLVAQAVIDTCLNFGLDVACFCDFDGGNEVITLESGKIVPLIDTSTLIRDFPDATVAICSYFQEGEGVKNPAQFGFDEQRVIPWEWIVNLIDLQLLFAKLKPFYVHINKYSWAFDFFDDDVSKQTVLDRLRLYLCDTMMKVNTPCSQYFEDGFISLGEREIFVDGGAHMGESAIAFIEKIKSTGGDYAHIYSFEPGSGNFEAAVKNTSRYPNVTVIQKGLWNIETELTFFDKNDTLGSSFVNLPEKPEKSGTLVQNVLVTSLDTFFSGMPESDWPTFIKMDIEGAEKEALLGAANIIRRVKPKLAICAYHKPEDVYILPKTIMRIRDDYKFALRQYKYGPHETVLYAV